jgi:hypothetical protein
MMIVYRYKRALAAAAATSAWATVGAMMCH